MFASRYVQALGFQVHYTEWGRPDQPVALLCHGHSRQSRDFDELAAALSADWRVICPDVIGRGLSEWSTEPDRHYRSAFYLSLLVDLLDTLGVQRCAWVGTSMGGRLGLMAAGGPLRERLLGFVINDMSPVRGDGVSGRIAGYMARPVEYRLLTEMEAYFREKYSPFGRMTDAQWRRFAEHSSRRLPNGSFSTHFDPRIADEMVGGLLQEDMWAEWDRIIAPTLAIRGEHSDVVPADVAREMTRRGPRARLATIANCGHAPPLHVPEQIELVQLFLVGVLPGTGPAPQVARP